MQVDDVLSRIEEYFHVLPLGEKSLDFGKILSTDTSIRILEAVHNYDAKVGLSASEISEMLGIGRTTVLYHLGRMQETGLVKINPVLENEDKWRRFWDLYRNRNADVTKEQFNKLHVARMNGVKLFVPTKKGFLVLPSADADESRSMVKEAFASITTPVIERDYRSMKKTTSLLGTLGLLLIALSFLFQLPSFQHMVGTGPTALGGKPTVVMEELAMETPVTVPPTTAAPAAGFAESRSAEKSAPAASLDADLAEKTGLAAEEEQVLETAESEKIIDRTAQISRVFFYVGILLLGSFLGFILYSYLRRR